MKTLIRISKKVIKLCGWAFLALWLYSLCSCARVQYVPVENTKRDSVYIKQYERDSIYQRDTVLIHSKADTVFHTKIQWRFRDRILRDTVRVTRCDTTTVIQEVERDFTRMERLKLNLGTGAIYLIIAAGLMAVFWFLKRLKGW